jgi:dipeptidyl aminopeptidase/acylaminoacyl peptidase
MGWGALRLGLILVVATVAFADPTAHATFPGENGKIAFSYCGPEDRGLFVMDPDGSGRTQITHNPYTESDRFGTHPLRDGSPAWSAQGDRIAFTRQIPYANPEVMVANADGSGVQPLGVPGNDPTWSPDGTRIAFWSFGGIEGSSGMFVMNADGSDVVLVHEGFNPRSFDWSPDGATIAYVDRRQEGWHDPEIWVIPAAGGTPTSLTPPDFSQGSAYPRSVNTGPSWSPDGTRIAFSSSEPGYQKDLYTMRADGRDKVRLTHTDEGLSPAWEESASWSPDGTRIAYERTLGTEPSGIVVTTADGAEETFLGPGFGTAWQPRPNESPDCSQVRATPAMLGAPNHRLVTVTLSGATDPEGDVVDLAITGVTQDEPVGAPDAVSTTIPSRVRLRAERDPKGDGRAYRIAFEASDGRGDTCTGFATVGVRKGSQAPVDSAPPSYDSFGS